VFIRLVLLQPLMNALQNSLPAILVAQPETLSLTVWTLWRIAAGALHIGGIFEPESR
jgi:hypothetical protein